MPKKDRATIIREIEKRTGTHLITYFTGDRRGLETRIGGDVLPVIYEHLRGIETPRKIGMFLYTTGGDALAGWGIVNLIRGFCTTFNILIPFKALSCGTLISLGADELIMAKGGLLSPIDPSIGSPYNPPAPGQMQVGQVHLLPVSFEDVVGYLKLAREEAGLKGDEGMGKVISALAEKVHPLALGAVYRSREQIRLLARRLLAMHEQDDSKITGIVDRLTKALPSHQYLISRREAKNELGLNIMEPSPELENLLWRLYKEYEKWLELNIPYNPEALLGSSTSVTVTLDRAVIESFTSKGEFRNSIFRSEREIRKMRSPQPNAPLPMTGIQERIIWEGWVWDVD